MLDEMYYNIIMKFEKTVLRRFYFPRTINYNDLNNKGIYSCTAFETKLPNKASCYN